MRPDRNSFSARLVVRPCPFKIKAYVKYLNHGMGAQLFDLTKMVCFCYGVVMYLRCDDRGHN